MATISVVSLGAIFLLALPAGATAAQPSAQGHLQISTASHPNSPVSGAPLTLAIFSVTDVGSGNTTTVTDHTVTLDTECGNSTTFLCLKLGGSDSFTVTVSSPLKAGQVHTTPPSDWAMTLRVGGKICGEFQTSAANIPPGYVGGFLQDQFDFAQSTKTLNKYAAQVTCTNSDVSITGTIAFNAQNTTPREGYYLYDNRGNTYGFGNDSYLTYLGNPGFLSLNAPIVSMATTPSGGGYWMTGSDGGVFAYGDARFFGSTGNIRLNKPIVGMAATAEAQVHPSLLATLRSGRVPLNGNSEPTAAGPQSGQLRTLVLPLVFESESAVVHLLEYDQRQVLILSPTVRNKRRMKARHDVTRTQSGRSGGNWP